MVSSFLSAIFTYSFMKTKVYLKEEIIMMVEQAADRYVEAVDKFEKDMMKAMIDEGIYKDLDEKTSLIMSDMIELINASNVLILEQSKKLDFIDSKLSKLLSKKDIAR